MEDQFNVITEIRYFRFRDPKLLLGLLRLDGVKEFFQYKEPVGHIPEDTNLVAKISKLNFLWTIMRSSSVPVEITGNWILTRFLSFLLSLVNRFIK